MNIIFNFSEPTIKAEVWHDFLKKAWFCHESIQKVTSDKIGVVIIDTGEAEVDEEHLRGLLLKALQESAKTNRLGKRILQKFESQGDKPVFGDIIEKLHAQGVLYRFDNGVYGYGGFLKTLMDNLDSVFVSLGDKYQPFHYEFPSSIPWEMLKRANYPAEFPQNLTFLSVLPKNIEYYNNFSRNPVSNPENLQPNGLFFAPTVCLMLYQVMQTQLLPENINFCVTAKGKCFRNEYIENPSLERLREFWLREHIFVGDKDYILKTREFIVAKMAALVEEWGLSGVMEVASDPFFTSSYVNKTFFQKISELKYELRLDINPAGNSTAVGSFNIHQTHFTDAFELQHPDVDELWTGCSGFGIERWAYAIFCQYGTDPKQWPETLRKLVK